MSRVSLRASHGQAAVELCALLPIVGLLALGAWQIVVCGQAVWGAGAAARAAARAHAVGADGRVAARRALTDGLERGLEVEEESDGKVAVAVRVPLVVGRGALFTVHQRARFAPQGG